MDASLIALFGWALAGLVGGAFMIIALAFITAERPERRDVLAILFVSVVLGAGFELVLNQMGQTSGALVLIGTALLAMAKTWHRWIRQDTAWQQTNADTWLD